MIVFPNAKINLGLSILSRRTDSYHELETVFYPVPLCDVLESVSCKDGENLPSLTVWSKDDCGEPSNNLVQRAYQMLADDFDIPPVTTHLIKRIPIGAGLGGGSADAAFMLRLLCDMYELPLSLEQLTAYASRLGADCAFFLKNKPCLATGIGDVLEPISLSLKGYNLLIVKPSFGISTAEAYAGVKPAIPDMPVREAIKMPVTCWKELLLNDFEKTLFLRYPHLNEIKEELYEKGAVYASMSGSGSAMFALFPPDVQPRECSFSKTHFTFFCTL